MPFIDGKYVKPSPAWSDGTSPAINATEMNAISDTLVQIPVANGGTGATTLVGARAALGLGNNASYITVDKGGTGATTAAGARAALGITCENIGALPTTGGTISGNLTVSGTLTAGISGNASTATKLATARSLRVSLGSSSAQSFDGSANATEIGVEGVLSTTNGGTGQSNGALILNSLFGYNQPVVLQSAHYGNTLPAAGTAGRIFFKKIS